ncbi:MAG: glycosyltransferase family 1 protein [Candidatus Latescibacteria bacterium]|nr:glycosyltransferase family 1 protein [Candidatus Latescibacterota bacterium]
MPHRILYVSEAVTFGGAERYLAILWARMDRRRFTPTLFCHPDTPETLVETARDRDVAVRFVAPVRGKWDVGGMMRQRRLFREAGADLIHFNLFNAYQGQYSILAARGTSRLVATYHLPPRMRTASVGGRLLERVVMGALDRVIAVCEAGADLLIRHFGARRGGLTVVRNGIEVERFAPGPGVAHEAMKGLRVVIAVGRLTPQKGLDTLIQAAPEVVRAVPDAGFLIVGDGPLRGELERMGQASGVGERIIFAGERRDVHDLMRGAQVLALPSVYEGLPLVALEAMACGLPVVASAVDGVPEAVADGETGVLVPVGDVACLADALIGLLRDPARGEAMGRRGRARAEACFSASRMAEETQAVYEACL